MVQYTWYSVVQCGTVWYSTRSTRGTVQEVQSVLVVQDKWYSTQQWYRTAGTVQPAFRIPRNSKKLQLPSSRKALKLINYNINWEIAPGHLKAFTVVPIRSQFSVTALTASWA